MRRKRSAYGRYRGSRRSAGVLIPVLLILCVIAAGTLYFLNENVTFTKDGAFFLRPSEEQLPEKVEANIIIEEPEEITPPPIEKTDEIRAYFVPIGTVKNSELFDISLTEIKEMPEINTLVLEVKAEDGMLAFATKSPLGVSAQVSGEDGVLTSAIEKARAGGYRVSFFVSAFKDNEAARKNQPYSARTQNKVIWIDGTNVRWLSAYSEKARGYITDIIAELSAFSPDEIVLSNVSFPAIGKTELLFYEEEPATAKRDAIKSFIDEAKTAAGKIKLSAVYENYNDDISSRSGQEAEDFSKNFASVYVAKDATRYTKAFEGAGISGAIPISAASSQEEYMIKK